METCPRPVLVIEDDHDIRLTLVIVLEEEGYPVLAAGNGRDALSVIEGADPRPGLVLLDLMMPIMNGWEFATILQSSAALAGIPFAVQSAFADHEPPTGAVAVMTKPVDIEAMLRLVEKHCR